MGWGGGRGYRAFGLCASNQSFFVLEIGLGPNFYFFKASENILTNTRKQKGQKNICRGLRDRNFITNYLRKHSITDLTAKGAVCETGQKLRNQLKWCHYRDKIVENINFLFSAYLWKFSFLKRIFASETLRFRNWLNDCTTHPRSLKVDLSVADRVLTLDCVTFE